METHLHQNHSSMFQVMSTGQLGDVALDHIPLLRITEDLTVQGARVVMVQGMADEHPLLTIHLEACQMATRHQQVAGVLNKKLQYFERKLHQF